MEKVLTLLVVHHIKLDGGKSFATFINDFYDPAIASALSNLNLKLLTFLESQPNFFHVDRQILPHILQLKSPPHLPLYLPPLKEKNKKDPTAPSYHLPRTYTTACY